MIDIHTHVLSNLRSDDGPKDPEKSRLMIQKAAEEGVTKIVATPHMLRQFPSVGRRSMKPFELWDLPKQRSSLEARSLPMMLF